MADLSKYDPEVVDKAFWLQYKIQREGIDGIHFMHRARRRGYRSGPRIVKNKINSNLRGL